MMEMTNEQTPDWEGDNFASTSGSEETLSCDNNAESSAPEEVVVPEVVNDSEKQDSRYRPRFSPKAAAEALKGNFLPILAAVNAVGGDREMFEQEITKVKITDALQDLMAVPQPFFKVGERVATNAEALGQVLMGKALAGDMAAIREILNRTEGKVPNVNKSASVKVTGDASSIGALMKKIDKNNQEG